MAQHADSDRTKHISNVQCLTLQTETMAREAASLKGFHQKFTNFSFSVRRGVKGKESGHKSGNTFLKIKQFRWNSPFLKYTVTRSAILCVKDTLTSLLHYSETSAGGNTPEPSIPL